MISREKETSESHGNTVILILHGYYEFSAVVRFPAILFRSFSHSFTYVRNLHNLFKPHSPPGFSPTTVSFLFLLFTPSALFSLFPLSFPYSISLPSLSPSPPFLLLSSSYIPCFPSFPSLILFFRLVLFLPLPFLPLLPSNSVPIHEIITSHAFFFTLCSFFYSFLFFSYSALFSLSYS